METYRLCRSGNHSQCQPDHCKVRNRYDNDANACLIARGVLDYLRDNNIPWERLGDELGKIRKQAQYDLTKYRWMTEAFVMDSVIAMEAKYVAISIMDAQQT